MTEKDIDDRLEEFAENPVGRAFLQFLPGGSSIDAAMSARVAQVQRLRQEWEARRADGALMQLIEWIVDLDESKLDRAYMISDQFADDFLEWYDRAVHVSHSAKREALRNALLNGATVDWRRTGVQDILMPLVADLSGPQIELLRTIRACEKKPPVHQAAPLGEGQRLARMSPIDDVLHAQPGLSRLQFDAFRWDFVRRDLLMDLNAEAVGRMPAAVYLSPFGHDFLRFIAEPPTRRVR